MWDKDAVAAVNAAGLNIVAGKNIATTQGYIAARRNDPDLASLTGRQDGTGSLLRLTEGVVERLLVDKDGNITIVGTVDGVDISGFKIVSIPAAAFVPSLDTYDWTISYETLWNRASLELQAYYAPVNLPHGATVSKLTLYGYRDDALASLELFMWRMDRITGGMEMAYINADWALGWGSGYDDTIVSPVIDTENYSYVLDVRLDPNDDASEVRFSGAKIELA